MTAPPDLSSDVCIVGAGIAGLCLADRLQRRGLSVTLLESGKATLDADLDPLSAGLSNDTNYPFITSRSRGFGGTSKRWYGACIRLDPADFEQRDWIAHSGWPLDFAVLAPYYEASRHVFGLPSDQIPIARLERSGFDGGDLAAKPVLFGHNSDLGHAFRGLLHGNDRVRVLLDATVTGFDLDNAGRRVTHARARSLEGNRIVIGARAFVLATGGIENARLMLVSALGRASDAVGRYHMEHPMRSVAVLEVTRHRDAARLLTSRIRLRSGAAESTFGLSPLARAREGLLDMHLRAYRYHPLEASEPVIAGKAALTALRCPDSHSRRRQSRALLKSVRPASLRYLAWHVSNKLVPTARIDNLRFTAFLEQEPDPRNRITLSAELDPLGVPLPHLERTESSQMNDSVARSLHILAHELTNRGVGRLEVNPAALAHLRPYDQYGYHHMGATRMNLDPRHGVVDAHCRVHGHPNLFVAGSSVFPTGGAANPSWTIAALALRLADRLRDTL